MQIFLHFFGHLAGIFSVIWREFVRSFGAILFGHLALLSSQSNQCFINKRRTGSLCIGEIDYFCTYFGKVGFYLVPFVCAFPVVTDKHHIKMVFLPCVRSFGGNLFGRLAQFCSVIWHFYPLNRTNVSLISVELVPFV